MSKAGTPREIALHDLQHDFLRILTPDLPALHNRSLDALVIDVATGDGPAHAWHALPADEEYAWIRLGEHMVAAGRAEEFQDLLLDYRWLEAKLHVTSISSLLSDFDAFPDDRDLAFIARALRRSTHIIGPDSDQLPSQLVGRLLGLEQPKIRAFVASIKTKRFRPWLRPLTPSLHSHDTGLLHSRESHSGDVRVVAVRANGRHAVSGSDDGSLTVWDMETGTMIWALPGNSGGVLAVSWSANGQCVISGSDSGIVQVWEVETGKVRTLEGCFGGVRSVALTPEGKHAVSGSDEGALTVWEVMTGREVSALPGNSCRVNAVRWIEGTHRIVSGSDDGLVRVWDVETGEVRTLACHSDSVLAVSLTADGRRVVSGSSDGTLKVWEVETQKEVRTMAGQPSSRVTTIAFPADGQRAVFGLADGKLEVCDLETGIAVRLVGHSHAVITVALTPDGQRAVSYSAGGTLRVWEVGTAKAVMPVDTTVACHAKPVRAVSLTADGQTAVSSSDDGTLKVWEVETGKEVRTLVCDLSPKAVSLTVEGRQLILPDNGTLRFWNAKTGREVSARKIPFDLVADAKMALTAEGGCAFSGPEATLRVWDPKTGEVRTWASNSDISAVALRADGRWVASGSSNGTLRLWEAETGKEVQTLPSPWQPLSVALTGDGCRAVCGAKTGWLRVWNLASVAVEVVFTADGPVYACAASSDGRTIVAGDALGRVHFLRLEGVDEQQKTAPVTTLSPTANLSEANRNDLNPEDRAMAPKRRKLKVFISYAHKDEDLKVELEERLKAIGRTYPIEAWSDRQILAGALVHEEILKSMMAADVVLLLISPAFVASDYCWTQEMRVALEQYEREGRLLVPIIVRRTTAWQESKIGRHLALPKDGRHLTAWSHPDEFWGDVEEGLRRLFRDRVERTG